jgi:hypothetical protein
MRRKSNGKLSLVPEANLLAIRPFWLSLGVMVGSDVFLYPETGPEFLKTLKMAALYSRRVHALTLTDNALIEGYLETSRLLGIANSKESRKTFRIQAPRPLSIFGGGVMMPSTLEAIQYLEFAQSNLDDLKMLAKANVFVSHFPTGFSYGGTFQPDENTARSIQRWPASYWDFSRKLPLSHQTTVAGFQGYLAFIAGLAQEQNAILGTWSLDFQQ